MSIGTDKGPHETFSASNKGCRLQAGSSLKTRRWIPGLKDRSGKSRVLPIYGMFLAMQGARSMFVIIIAWFALRITGEVSAVGKVLIFWQLFNLTIGPFMGMIIDGYNRRSMFVLGESLCAVGAAALAVQTFLWLPERTDMLALYAAACIASLGSLFSLPAIQALVQIVGGPMSSRIVAVGVLYSQAGNILGAVIGGLSVANFGIVPSLAICVVFHLAAAGFSALLVFDKTRDLGLLAPGNLKSVLGGFRVIARSRLVLIACLGVVSAFAISHMTNAFLGAFTLYELQLNADAYGWLAAALSFGGICGGVMLVLFRGGGAQRFIFHYGLLLLALATAGFSVAQNFWQAIFWHGLMGLAFVAVKAVCDMQILKLVSNDMIGRVQCNIAAAIGATGFAVYLLPSIVPDLSVRHAYLGFAAVLVLVFALSEAVRRYSGQS